MCCLFEVTAIMESTDDLPSGMHICEPLDEDFGYERIKWDCFEADLFELQLDVTPSWKLRSRIAEHLRDVISAERIKTAHRSRLLHWMLAHQTKLEAVE
jgi:hypothetical protein